MGWPGAQVICSTGLFISSHRLAFCFTGLSSESSTGFPATSKSSIGQMRELTLDAGHVSRDGVKM